MNKVIWLVGCLFWLSQAGWAYDTARAPAPLEEEPGIKAEVHGYFKLDVSFDDSPTVPGDYVKWVAAGTAGDADDGFNGTVNQTRLGLAARGALGRRGQLGGQLEIDFFGSGEGADPRIRHAFVELSWPEAAVDLLVGQTSDVISPLVPATLNYTAAWWAGNIGYRRPQLRLTKTWTVGRATSSSDETGGRTSVKLEAALTHNIYDTKVGSLTGEDAGFPAVQTRASVTLSDHGARPVTLGISGHRAHEDFAVASAVATQRCDSWSVNLDASVPIAAVMTLEGELFTGAGLAPYLGGVGQGFDPETGRGIHSRGGWLAMSYAPVHGCCRLALGFSIDDVDGDEVTAGGRTSNRSVFGNMVYAVNRHLDFGIELSHWRTEYQGLDDADALRTQTSVFYKF